MNEATKYTLKGAQESAPVQGKARNTQSHEHRSGGGNKGQRHARPQQAKRL